MSKLSWFKHYNTASEGSSLEKLFAVGCHEAVACYWSLLELVSRYEKEEKRGFIEVPIKLLAKKWFMTCPKVERILDQLAFNMRSTLDYTLSKGSPKVASIFLRNWLDLQENRGGKKRAKNEQSLGEVRSKKKELDKEVLEPLQPTPKRGESHTAKIRDCFLEEYKKKFKHDYLNWGAKENGQIKNWLRSIALEKALELIPLFMRWNDPYVVKAGHPVGLLVTQHVRLWTDYQRSQEKYLATAEHKETQEELKNAAAIKLVGRQAIKDGSLLENHTAQIGQLPINGD
jgi:hypothetical protein